MLLKYPKGMRDIQLSCVGVSVVQVARYYAPKESILVELFLQCMCSMLVSVSLFIGYPRVNNMYHLHVVTIPPCISSKVLTGARQSTSSSLIREDRLRQLFDLSFVASQSTGYNRILSKRQLHSVSYKGIKSFKWQH